GRSGSQRTPPGRGRWRLPSSLRLREECPRSRWLLRAADRSAGGDQCPDLLTTDRLDDGVLALRAEDQHGQAVVHAEAERGRVGDPQPLPERFAEGDGVELTGG